MAVGTSSVIDTTVDASIRRGTWVTPEMVVKKTLNTQLNYTVGIPFFIAPQNFRTTPDCNATESLVVVLNSGLG